MKRTFKATVLFGTDLGESKTIQVSFSVYPSQDTPVDELLDNWAIFEGYEYCHQNDIPTVVFNDDGFYHLQTISVEEVK